ncbi:2320_t:CDS:2, partial [Acaulospora colombiana]
FDAGVLDDEGLEPEANKNIPVAGAPDGPAEAADPLAEAPDGLAEAPDALAEGSALAPVALAESEAVRRD